MDVGAETEWTPVAVVQTEKAKGSRGRLWLVVVDVVVVYDGHGSDTWMSEVP